eukprot:6203682-Pleurochrysis_carterae.AAC.3
MLLARETWHPPHSHHSCTKHGASRFDGRARHPKLGAASRRNESLEHIQCLYAAASAPAHHLRGQNAEAATALRALPSLAYASSQDQRREAARKKPKKIWFQKYFNFCVTANVKEYLVPSSLSTKLPYVTRGVARAHISRVRRGCRDATIRSR